MIDKNVNWCGICSEQPAEAEISLMGIPFDGGASQGKGAALAPDHIRQLAAFFMPCATDDWKLIRDDLIYDFGDVEVDLNWEATFQRVEDEAYKMMKAGNFNLFIGGDHSVTIPLHKAFKRYEKEKKADAKIGIIHFDAHFDLCDFFEGHKWSHGNTERRALEEIIEPKDLAFLGIRAAEPDELEVINAHPEITVLSATDVFRHGYQSAFDQLQRKFAGYDALYFTLDIDVLDPAYAPGTGTPAAGGISARELIELVRLILAKLPVKSMDIVEVSPPLDVNDITSWAAIRIIQEVISRFNV